MMAVRNHPHPGTQALARAVRLLKTFSDVQPAWRLSDLARAARLHKATAHRLLAALDEVHVERHMGVASGECRGASVEGRVARGEWRVASDKWQVLK